jgi:hypothetical protein
VNDAVLDNLLKLLFRNTESWVDFVERANEVPAGHAQVLDVFRDPGHGSDLTRYVRR